MPRNSTMQRKLDYAFLLCDLGVCHFLTPSLVLRVYIWLLCILIPQKWEELLNQDCRRYA